MRRAHTSFASFRHSKPYPHLGATPPKTQKKRALPDTCKEWDEDVVAEDAVTEDVTIRQKTPQTPVPPPQPSPRPTNQQTSETRPQKRKQAEGPTPPALDAQAQPNKKR